MTSPKINGPQLELFTQDFYAALEPAPAPVSRLPLFKAPPKVIPPAPPAAPPLSPKRHIQLGNYAIEYELRRSTRRSIGFTIDDSGLRVTAPKRLTLAEIDNAIRAKQRWILSKMHERGERVARREKLAPVEWVDGARLPYLGGEITLKLEDAPRSRCDFDPDTKVLTVGVVAGLEEWQLVERVRLWFEAEARRIFRERMDHYAGKMGVRYSALLLSSAGTRWGSCTVQGAIRLNWKLVHYAMPLIDYVVAHELAHLREMNHSPRFWATVGSVYPDYDGAKAALRKRSQEMPTVFA
jgi:predicted metal-dependent hydrolase